MGQAEEIKSKLDIVEVIREYIQVKAVGANFQSVCPFHNEKSASFVISPDKQIWHCFGCGRGGDVFSFVMEKEGLGFMEAMRLLAPKAGVTLTNENPEEYSKRNRILDILELAGKYYAYNLNNSANKNPLKYLDQRGLKSETINEWQLGYSPDSWDSLYNFLKARPLSGQKFTDEEMFAAGVIIKKDAARSQGGYYDRFRDRIMFPIWDVNNNLIAFTARVNPEKEKTEKMGKYINSQQSEEIDSQSRIYDKSKVLFGLNKAKNAIRREDLAIVVEGQMDVISCHQAGFNNVIASSGTALTMHQLILLKRFTNNIAFSLDEDAAGKMAKERGGDLVNSKLSYYTVVANEKDKETVFWDNDITHDLNIYIIEIPNGKDPDECIRNNSDDFKKAIENKKPLMQYFFDKIFLDFNIEDVLDGKKRIILFLEKLAKIRNNVEVDGWLKKLHEKVDVTDIVLREEFRNVKNNVNRVNIIENKKIVKDFTREEKLSEMLLSLLVKFPNYLSYTINNLEPELLAGEANIGIYKSLIIHYNKVAILDYQAFHAYLLECGEGREKLLDKLILLGEKDFYNYEDAQVKSEIIKIIIELKKYSFQKKIKKIEKALIESEKKGGGEETVILMDELKNLTDEIKKINLN